MKGYKVFNPDFTCHGFQYTENTEFVHEGELELCRSGFHFCEKAIDCFSYYRFDPQNIVCEVESRGETITEDDEDKIVTNKLYVGKRLTWSEVSDLVNIGRRNTGHSNSGHGNSGNCNTGHYNSGHFNSGYGNSGRWNTGDYNSGNFNSGNRNSGNRNSGHGNSGDHNSGDGNSGHGNSGHGNSGNCNTGHYNSGHCNSGDRNSGHGNSGSRNSGYANSGNRNSGNRNTGCCNSGNHHSGSFCTEKDPYVCLFDKPTDIRASKWFKSEAVRLINRVTPNKWIDFSDITDEEKKQNPTYQTTGYCLKTISLHEAWKIAWGNFSDEERRVFLNLPNFDAGKFEEITGINV